MILVDSHVNRLWMQIIDALLGVLAFVLARTIRLHWFEDVLPLDLPPVAGFSDYAFFFPIILVIGPVVLYRLNFYNTMLNERPSYSLNLAFQAGLILFIVLVVTQFLLRIQMSRSIFVIFVPLYAFIIFGRQWMVARSLRYMAQRNLFQRNMVVVTDRMDLKHWEKQIHQCTELGFRVCRSIPLSEFTVKGMVETLHDHSVELVIFDVRSGELSEIMPGIRACEDEGIETWFSTSFFDTQIAVPKIDHFGGQTFLIFRATPDSSWELFFKVVMDRLGALLLLIFLSPLFLFCALLVRLTSPGPVLFRQQRSGLYGRPFTMYKFRSMNTNAEQMKEELRILNEMSGPVFKMRGDPRVTRVGAWLRRTSLDELPQLFNVLKGEMSLVGPRPLPVDETLAISENAQRRRLSVKPGLTCLWQVSGRNEVTNFSDWVKLDLHYIDNWSLGLDVKILLRTIPVVLCRRGAR